MAVKMHIGMCMLINALLLFVACCLLVCGALCNSVGRRVSLYGAQSQPASAKLQNVFKELALWSRKV